MMKLQRVASARVNISRRTCGNSKAPASSAASVIVTARAFSAHPNDFSKKFLYPITMAYAQPVTTDATAASEPELREAASLFLTVDRSTITFERCKGGVNNKVYRVAVAKPDGETDRYVLRIYNNGFNEARVKYEHKVLSLLADKATRSPFAFRLPSLLHAVSGSPAEAANTYVELASGAHACMFKSIPGGGAPLSAAFSIGKSTAELVEAMKDMKIDLPLPNPLYRNIYEAHSKITRELFFDAVVNWPDFNAPADVKGAMNYLVAELLKAEKLVETCIQLRLPEQQIHADLHFDNVLAEGDTVTGLLDFEFSAYDWRVMEMCVGLSKYVSIADAEPLVQQWVEGYAAGGGRLTEAEANLVPELLILRILSNVVYFVGRAVAKEDTTAALTARADMYKKRIEWVYGKKEWMVALLKAKLVQQ